VIYADGWQCRGCGAAGDVFALWGDLGMGKTRFARAFVAARAGAETEVPSPTFTLVQTYDLPGGPVWHFDLYRLADPEEIWELGWEAAREGASALIEWPQRGAGVLPKPDLDITISPQASGRSLLLQGYGARGEAWCKALSGKQ
jgi:tRNA threonylcarbamoyladenosine biosynthesis protein TsaE